MATPIPQDNRPITLTLFDGGGLILPYVFFPRPEQMEYHEPNRVSVMQTLGGAWADDWGAGIVEVTMSGTTGWRGGSLLPGEASFLYFRELIVERFHERRLALANQGLDPDAVQLWLADTLNSKVAQVFPVSFVLKRSRTRPLLFQFDLRLSVLDMVF